MAQTLSVNDIRTAIRELSTRAELARKEGRPGDAAEIEQRIQHYREELAARPETPGQPPSRRKALRWKTIGATSSCTVMSLTRSTTIV